jgi:hypothetical protein
MLDADALSFKAELIWVSSWSRVERAVDNQVDSESKLESPSHAPDVEDRKAPG